MKRHVYILLLLITYSLPAQTQREVEFKTNDGLTIFGDLYLKNKDKSMILLFHQAGSCAQGEYENIIPVLSKNGFNILAIDQRSGGSKLGGINRTVNKLNGKEYGYCETYPDFEATLNYVTNELNCTGKIIAWGSSYSAAMVVHLKADYPDKIAGILAFSPASGGPMKPCSPNDKFNDLNGSALILRPAREMEIPSVQDQLALAKEAGLSTHVSKNGVHGSSMLNPDRVDGSTDETWAAVLSFLTSF